MAKTKKKRPSGGKARSHRAGSNETLKTAVYAILIALFIRTFIVQAFRIPSGSMEDTLLIGDFLLVDKLTYGATIPLTNWRLPGFRDPRRGDIIVFKDPRTDRDFIKRCIATGGETVKLERNDVFIDGHPITEPYKTLRGPADPNRANFGPLTVSRGSLFMMGDNRNNSQDSRFWDEVGNQLDARRVVGRAFVLYWSTDPKHAPRWVRNLGEGWVKGFLQLLLGRPRITRIGTWLAKDYRSVYAQSPPPGPGAAAAAPVPERKGSAADTP